MNCPFKNSENCSKKIGLCILCGILAIAGIALVLKLVTIILCIFPGNIAENTALVVTASIIVLVATRRHFKKSCCNNCDCNDSGCCNPKEPEEVK